MDSLADKIISQQDMETPLGFIPEGYYVDDMGYLVETDIRKDKARYAEYLLTRIINKHPNIFWCDGILFHDWTIFRFSKKSIIEMIDLPTVSINDAQAVWIYNRLKEYAPALNDRYIEVCRGKVWDKRQCKLIDKGELIEC